MVVVVVLPVLILWVSCTSRGHKSFLVFTFLMPRLRYPSLVGRDGDWQPLVFSINRKNESGLDESVFEAGYS